MELDETLRLLLAHLSHVRKSKDGYTARCNVHDDHRNSLSIKVEHDKILIHCFAGCAAEDVARKAGLEMSDLFEKTNGHTKRMGGRHVLEMPATEAKKIVDEYPYDDEHGTELFQSVRFEPKGFAQRHRVNGAWQWDLKGVRLVPYNLPAVIRASTVYIVEGEKDVATMRERFGVIATTNPMGAGKWRDEYSEFFHGKTVTIIPDNDTPGRDHAQKVASSLFKKTSAVRICQLPTGIKDVSEWAEKGFSKDALLEYLEKNSVPWTQVLATEIFHTREQWESTKPLSFAIDRFYQNHMANAIAGLAGHGKTFVMLSSAKKLLEGEGKLWDVFEVVERFERIVYLIPEATIEVLKHRLQLLGMYDYALSGRLLVRTLSMGPMVKLEDARILEASKGCPVFLDTAIRFLEGDENSATDIQKGLATDIFNLLGAGAKLVIFAHHSPKNLRGANEMTLENMMRGSADLGALVGTAHGVYQMEQHENILHVQNLKPANFEPVGPFQLQGRPAIDVERDFRLYKPPGNCGKWEEERPNQVNETRAKTKDDRVAIVCRLLDRDPNTTTKELLVHFRSELGIEVSESSMRAYKAEALKSKRR